LRDRRVVDRSFEPRRVGTAEIQFSFLVIAKFEREKVLIDETLFVQTGEDRFLPRVADLRIGESENTIDVATGELRRNGGSGSDDCGITRTGEYREQMSSESGWVKRRSSRGSKGSENLGKLETKVNKTYKHLQL
jgi:hypothetical protein